MQFKMPTLFALLVVFLCSCEREKKEKGSEDLNREEVVRIQQEIMDHMQVVIEGIEENDPDKLFGDFWRSDSVTFYLNGMQMKGYDRIVEGFSQGMQSRRNTSIEITGQEVVVLGGDAAMHLAEFTNEMTLVNDTTVTVAGYWSAVFKKMNGQWKVMHVHESFNPVP